MLVRLKNILLLVLATGISSHLFAQANFSASISPAVIGKDETAQLSFTVENAQQVGEIQLPSLKDFDILSGPNQQSSMTIINGVTKQSSGVSYIIKPKATGSFTIGGASVNVNGKELHSNKVTLKVTKNPQGNSNNQTQTFTFGSPFGSMQGFDQPTRISNFKEDILKDGENVQEKISKNIFVKVSADKNSCYIGEPVVVTYKLYTRLKVETNVTKSPAFNGFSVIDLVQPGNIPSDVEELDGKKYNVCVLRKLQLYPLQSGKFELEPIETDNNIYFIKEAYAKQHADNADNLFDDFEASNVPSTAVDNERVTLQSKPLTINVKALPEKDKPASFKGAVGNFTITADVERNNFSTDEGGKLGITISGNGNMTLLNAPEINFPGNIEGFEPSTNDNINKLTIPVSGNKVFIYAFNVSKEGNYTLPPVEFSFFDPKSGKYKTISTKPIPLTITKGYGKPTVPMNSTFNNSTEKKNADSVPNYRWLIFIAVAFFVTSGLLFYIRQDNKKTAKDALAKKSIVEENILINTEPDAPINPLVLTEAKLIENDSKGFYSTLNKELKDYFAARFQLAADEVNKKRIAEEMDKKGIAITASLKAEQLLDDIEWQLYTPFHESAQMQDSFENASQLIHSIEIYFR